MVYEARYLDGKRLELLAHPDFKNPKAAQAIAYPVAKAIGRLPTSMRAKLSHVVLHKGDHTAFGEDRGRFFVLYSQNVKKRLSTHDLDETVFHESVHATLDHPHAASGKWRRAQRKDRTFLTRYAERNPAKKTSLKPRCLLMRYNTIRAACPPKSNVRFKQWYQTGSRSLGRFWPVAIKVTKRLHRCVTETGGLVCRPLCPVRSEAG